MRAYIKDDFRDLLDYRKWVDEESKRLRGYNQTYFNRKFRDANTLFELQDPTWFGPNVRLEELKNGVTQYQYPELIERIQSGIDQSISAETKDKVKSRKLQYNALGLGIFSFDRAAMGMYWLDEFFSPILNSTVEKEAVKQVGKDKYKLIADDSPVIKRKEYTTEGKPKVRTTAKKVYAYFPPTSKLQKAVEIYVSCGGHGETTAEEFLYSGMVAIIIAQILIKARVQVKINIVIGTQQQSNDFTGCVVPIKNYDEPLDINLLALLTSDPRFYRYDGFKGIVCAYNHFDRAISASLGTGANGDRLQQIMETSDYAQRRATAENRFYFGRVTSEREAVMRIERAIHQISQRLNK